MATKVKIQMDSSQKILLRRYLNQNGKAQQYFTKQVAAKSEPYIPFDTGRLKDIDVTIETKRIIYSAPYAKKQYYSNKGMGKGGLHNGGLRGSRWIPRMWTQKGDEIVQSVAKFCGGKKK